MCGGVVVVQGVQGVFIVALVLVNHSRVVVFHKDRGLDDL